MDSKGNQSKEIDLILYDPLSLPGVMYSARDGLIPIESALLTIEVKTEITSELFKDALENALSVWRLVEATTNKQDSNGRMDWETRPTVNTNYVFAFKGPTTETVDGWIQATPDRYRPVLRGVCVVGSGFVWQPWTAVESKTFAATEEHDEVIQFIARIDAAISIARRHRESEGVMGRYLVRE